MLNDVLKFLRQDNWADLLGPDPVHMPAKKHHLESAKNKLIHDRNASLTQAEAKAVLDDVVYQTRAFIIQALQEGETNGELKSIRKEFFNKTADLNRNNLDGGCIVASTYAGHCLEQLGLKPSYMHSEQFDPHFPKYSDAYFKHAFNLVSMNVEGTQKQFLIDLTYRQFCAETYKEGSDLSLSEEFYFRKRPPANYPGVRLTRFDGGQELKDQLLKFGYAEWNDQNAYAYSKSLLNPRENPDFDLLYSNAKKQAVRNEAMAVYLIKKHGLRKPA